MRQPCTNTFVTTDSTPASQCLSCQKPAGVSCTAGLCRLLEQGIDAFWLLKIHSGRFGPLNLQPYYSGLLGLFTLVVIGSGLALLLSSRRAKV